MKEILGIGKEARKDANLGKWYDLPGGWKLRAQALARYACNAGTLFTLVHPNGKSTTFEGAYWKGFARRLASGETFGLEALP